ncbi:MAG: VWA domain-containing protein [Pseudomonadota bacterium]|nr:VWA domain-containing protein [Pseudomonadota bacterium]
MYAIEPEVAATKKSVMSGKKVTKKSDSTEIQDFLRKVALTPSSKKQAGPGRLIFCLDATASRQPTWDRACQLQGEMFLEAGELGGLEVQLTYFRGFGEFVAGPWVNNANLLLKGMTGVFCMAGETQIGKVLRHTIKETKTRRVSALVLIGDSIEEEIDKLGVSAGELGILGVPMFIFQEGVDRVAEYGFSQLAKLTGGAHCRLDQMSAAHLREFLGAVAVFGAGGQKALEDYGQRKGGSVLQIAKQLKGS